MLSERHHYHGGEVSRPAFYSPLSVIITITIIIIIIMITTITNITFLILIVIIYFIITDLCYESQKRTWHYECSP